MPDGAYNIYIQKSINRTAKRELYNIKELHGKINTKFDQIYCENNVREIIWRDE